MQNAKLGKYTEEQMSAIKLVIAFGREEYALSEYGKIAKETQEISKKTEKTKTLKDDLKVGITYRADQLKSLGKFALQKGKNKIYGQIDLLKTKID